MFKKKKKRFLCFCGQFIIMQLTGLEWISDRYWANYNKCVQPLSRGTKRNKCTQFLFPRYSPFL